MLASELEKYATEELAKRHNVDASEVYGVRVVPGIQSSAVGSYGEGGYAPTKSGFIPISFIAVGKIKGDLEPHHGGDFPRRTVERLEVELDRNFIDLMKNAEEA